MCGHHLHVTWWCAGTGPSLCVCVSSRAGRTGAPSVHLRDQQVNHDVFHRTCGSFFEPSWLRCEMAQQSSSFTIKSLATSIECSELLVGRSVLLYDGWCLCVDLSEHGHPEGAEVDWLRCVCCPVSITRTWQRDQSPTAYFTCMRRECNGIPIQR